jgi:hypothetical protein
MSKKYMILGFLLGLAFCELISHALDFLAYADCVEWDDEEACEIAEKAGYKIP